MWSTLVKTISSPIFEPSAFLKKRIVILAILLSVSSAYVPVSETVRPNLSGLRALPYDEEAVKSKIGGVLSIINGLDVMSDLFPVLSVAYALTLYFPS